PEAHVGLGLALREEGRLDEAIASFKEALRLKKDYPEAHCFLGLALRYSGDLAAALPHLRRGHELGSRNPHWRRPSAPWVEGCQQRLADLDAGISAALQGQEEVVGAQQRLAYARHCQNGERPHASARFYWEAFALDPALADATLHGGRYNAA